MDSPVKIGVVGVGGMGYGHCKRIEAIDTLSLTACCDIAPERAQKVAERFGATPYDNYKALIRSGTCDAILIATPHFDHTPVGIAALKAGLHVLVEKPISVHKQDAERLIRAHTRPEQVFAAMMNQRTDPAYQRIRAMLRDGTLGDLRRFQWTVTHWFRSQAYFDSGGWRATWAGEGGGVLLNQSLHQLDILQWLFGMPVNIRAFCQFGKHHDIEVEDEVTAYLEFANGATGTFITSTGEAPGSNRMEIAADNGRVVFDTSDKEIRIDLNDKPVTRALVENDGFTKPGTTEQRVAVDGDGGQHSEILENFASAILKGEKLIAPAAEGIHAVELANSLLMSAWTDKSVSLPISARRYANQLKKRIETSRPKKDVADKVMDMSSSFS